MLLHVCLVYLCGKREIITNCICLTPDGPWQPVMQKLGLDVCTQHAMVLMMDFSKTEKVEGVGPVLPWQRKKHSNLLLSSTEKRAALVGLCEGLDKQSVGSFGFEDLQNKYIFHERR